MKGEIILVELSPKRNDILILVRIERPIFPRDYTDTKKSEEYLEAVERWQSIHTGEVTFDYFKALT